MEAGDGAAGHGDEHERPDVDVLRMLVIEVVPQLGHLILMGEQQNTRNTDGHDDQADTEDGVDLADDLVDGNEGGDEVVDDDDPQPEGSVQLLGGQQSQQTGGTLGEHDADHDQQDDGEHAHDLQHDLAQISTGNLGNAGALVPHGQHTAHIVVDAAGEDGTEDDPQIDDRSKQSTVQSAEDGAETGDVQQLNQEDLPTLHRDEVNAVVERDGRRLPVVRAKDLVYALAVEDVADDQSCNAENESKHRFPP
jgi:hypothetical protein